MVWVLCEIALRPDSQEEIHAEIKSFLDKGLENLTHDDLQKAVLTDSFLREVMRTKGDTFSTVRMAMNDVALGKYIVPKGKLHRFEINISDCAHSYLILCRLHGSPQCSFGTQCTRAGWREPRDFRRQTVG